MAMAAVMATVLAGTVLNDVGPAPSSNEPDAAATVGRFVAGLQPA